jgi:hypothetical protein
MSTVREGDFAAMRDSASGLATLVRPLRPAWPRNITKQQTNNTGTEETSRPVFASS